jgi:hypothetical protein
VKIGDQLIEGGQAAGSFELFALGQQAGDGGESDGEGAFVQVEEGLPDGLVFEGEAGWVEEGGKIGEKGGADEDSAEEIEGGVFAVEGFIGEVFEHMFYYRERGGSQGKVEEEFTGMNTDKRGCTVGAMRRIAPTAVAFEQ